MILQFSFTSTHISTRYKNSKTDGETDNTLEEMDIELNHVF